MWILIIGIVVVLFIIIFANGEQKRSDVVKQTSEYDYYKQKKAYENSIYEENVKNEKSHIGANSFSSTQKLSSHVIRSYLPYMDSKLASMYRKAILDGQYSFSVGKGLIEQWEKNRILKKTAVSSTTTSSIVPKEFTNLTWWQLQQYNPVMSLDESADYLAEHLINESKLLTVKTSRLKEWEKQLAEYKKNEIDLQQTTDNNNKGIALEKEGNIASAIEVYEANLKIGYPATHSYKRLMVIYHKEKRYEDEIRVIKKAIGMFSLDERYDKDVTKWQERLNKLIK